MKIETVYDIITSTRNQVVWDYVELS